jgi:Na+:H+ antiporter, NhaA family
LLLLSTALAMVWANSPWSASYAEFWNTPVSLVVGTHALTETLSEWINDGLMAMFFFVVGVGDQAGNLGGGIGVVPSGRLAVDRRIRRSPPSGLLYSALNATGPGARGWGIPMATDIAFALGILALLGRRVPLALKVFLMVLAIADDSWPSSSRCSIPRRSPGRWAPYF